MSLIKYTYNISEDTESGVVNDHLLQDEIMTVGLDNISYVSTKQGLLNIFFSVSLNGAEQTLLTQTVNAHTGIAPFVEIPDEEVEVTAEVVSSGSIQPDPNGTTAVISGSYDLGKVIIGPNEEIYIVTGEVSGSRRMRKISYDMPIFGSEHHYAEEMTVSSTTSKKYVQKLRMSTSGISGGTYRLSWSYTWKFSGTSRRFEARIQINDQITIYEQSQEPKDSNNVETVTGYANIYLNGDADIDLDYCRSGNPGTSYIGNVKLELFKVDNSTGATQGMTSM